MSIFSSFKILFSLVIIMVFLLYVPVSFSTSITELENKKDVVSKLPISLNANWQLCFPDENSHETIDVLHDCQPILIGKSWEKQQSKISDGRAVYRTHFFIPLALKEKSLGIFLGQIRDADKTYLNHQLIGQMGRFAPEFEKANLYSRYYYLPSHLIYYGQDNELVVDVYNDSRDGGLLEKNIRIDEWQTLVDQQVKQQLPISIIMVVLAVIGFSQLVFYTFIPRGKDLLFFGISAFCYTGYLFTYSIWPVFFNMNLNVIFRLNFIFFYLIVIFFTQFYFQFFRARLPLIIKALYVVAAINILLVPFQSFTSMYYWLDINLLLVLMAILVTVGMLWRAYKEKLPYAGWISSGIAIHLLFSVYDILQNFEVVSGFNFAIASMLTPLSLLYLSFLISIILAHKHWQHYKGATFDELTGLLRRQSFINRLEEETARIKRDGNLIFVAMLDLDKFKIINDQLGHLAGDNVLVNVAKVLNRCTRSFDLVGRYGGDEFCIAMEVMSAEDGKKLLQRIQQSISEIKLAVGQQTYYAQATLGAVVIRPDTEVSLDGILHEADNQLIAAKHRERGIILIDNELVASLANAS